MSRYLNALLTGVPQAPEPLESEVKRLIRVHGKAAVRDAAKRLTAGKIGRPELNDLPAFATRFEQDARDWLDGNDPNKRMSSRALAKRFAKDSPGHDELATFERIYEKLRKERKFHFLFRAFRISESEYPVNRHLLAIRAINGERANEVWDWTESHVVNEIEIFKKRGGVVGDKTPLSEIKSANFAATELIASGSRGLGLISYMRGETEANKPTTENAAEKPSD